MRKVNNISYERLIEIIRYDASTGYFYRKVKTSNRCNMTDPIGTSTAGYLQTTIDNKKYYLHRLAWFYMTGKWPINEIDHIDNNRFNNKFENLRQATGSENQHNRGMQDNNKSGYKGVTWHKQKNKWMAQIMCNKKYKYLGLFVCPIEAHKAYCMAAKTMHKEFTNLGT